MQLQAQDGGAASAASSGTATGDGGASASASASAAASSGQTGGGPVLCSEFGLVADDLQPVTLAFIGRQMALITSKNAPFVSSVIRSRVCRCHQGCGPNRLHACYRIGNCSAHRILLQEKIWLPLPTRRPAPSLALRPSPSTTGGARISPCCFPP